MTLPVELMELMELMLLLLFLLPLLLRRRMRVTAVEERSR